MARQIKSKKIYREVSQYRMPERKGIIVSLFNEQCGYCCYCSEKMTLKLGKKRTATVEHILPRSYGGKNEFNLAAACDYCNNERGNMPLLIYLLSKKYNKTRHRHSLKSFNIRG
jgi:5-methylcytosine-specific restriction endonuclease McrA